MGSDKKILGFVKPEKGPRHYVTRYIRETEYRAWFERNYPEYEFHEGIGISRDEFDRIAAEVSGMVQAGETAVTEDVQDAGKETVAVEDDMQDAKGAGSDVSQVSDNNAGASAGSGKAGEPAADAAVQEQDLIADNDTIQEKRDDSKDGGRDGEKDELERLMELAQRMKDDASGAAVEQDPARDAGSAPDGGPARTASGEELARTVFDSYADDSSYDRRTFEEFVDERVLISRDLMGTKEMKIKILEVSDEIQESKIRWKFGDRVKVNKILITIKHLDTMEVEEGEFDIAAIEKELAEKRHYSSTNRWIPSGDIKNGYVVNSKHTALISDAVALDYIVF